MPTYGFAIIFFTNNYISTFTASYIKYIILAITFVFTCLLPVINVFILYKAGRISSLNLDDSNDRTLPYMSTLLYYAALFYLFYNAQFPNIFKILILGGAACILITLLVNFKWKISAHMIGVGGTVGAMLGIIYRLQQDMVLILVLVIFIAGCVGFARLKLNAHSPSQVYSGFALGFLAELLLMMFY